MVDNVPPDEGCEVFDGEVNDEEWDKMTIKKLVKWGGGVVIVKCYRS